jgi:capsular polysaccharide biosynthesis protein/tetratricopeptide (TPR) repeat protein
LEAAIERRPRSRRVLRALLSLYSDLGYGAAGRRVLRQFIDRQSTSPSPSPTVGRLWADLGDLEWAIGQDAGAIAAYEQADRTGYQSTYLQERAARFWATQGDWARSKQAWWTAIAWEPSDRPDWQEALCFVLFMDGDFDGAIAAGEQAISMGGDRALVWQRLARAHERRGNDEQVEPCQQTARQRAKADPMGWLPQVAECSTPDEWRRAYQWVRSAPLLDPIDPAQLADLASRAADWSTALQALDRALQDDPTNPDRVTALAATAAQAGQRAITAALWQMAIERDPSPAVYYAAAEAERAIGGDRDWVAYWRSAVQHNPTAARAYESYGQALEAADQPIAALVAYGVAIALADRRLDIPWQRVGSLLEQQGWWRWAERFWGWAADLAPDSAWMQAMNQRAIAQRARSLGQWQRAIDHCFLALRYHPEFWPAYDELQRTIAAADLPPPDPSPTSPDLFCQLPEGLAEAVCQVAKGWDVVAAHCGSDRPNPSHRPDHADRATDDCPTIRCIPAFGPEAHALVPSQTPDDRPLTVLQAVEQPLIAPEAYTVEIQQGRAWGGNLGTTVFDQQGRVLRDCSTGYSAIVASSPHLPPPVHLAGTTAFLATRWSRVNYFHWMFDVVARIGVLRQSGFAGDDIDHWVVAAQDLPFQIDSLQRLRIPRAKIVVCCDAEWLGSIDPIPHRLPHLTADRLLVPAIPELRSYRGASWARRFLRDRFLEPERSRRFPERIYITRRSVFYRQVINEPAVIEFLQGHGFQILDPGQLPLVDQAAAFAAAKVIVSVHGAGLTNLVFAQPGATVIEIFPPGHCQNTYWLLSNLGGLAHYHLTAQVDPRSLGQTAVMQNISIDLERLGAALRLAKLI